ncbi:hypothetical protein BU17DRAFT_94947 [Hysterangium stoloniferum]|nr:hypothetical protein BU17DRAFT_94947 [Hysterangium stoloniferum]
MVLINCLLVGDDKPFQHIFPVQASPYETIGQLRQKILEKKPKWQNRINADELTLYTPKQMISTHSKDVFNAIFTQLKLDVLEERDSVLNELNPTFTVDESGLSQPARRQLHVLVVVPAERISPSNSSNSGLSDILAVEPAAKRLCVEGSVMSHGPIEHIHSKVPPMMLDYYRRFWGSPLHPALTPLPDQANTTNPESEEQESNDEVLPGEPFLTDVSLPMLVRAEYIRVLDAVKAAHQKSHNTLLAVVTGQPGIGKTSWINYAIRYCLGERQPVVWYQVNKCYFFSESGVDVIDPMLHQSGGKHTWCLVDSLDAPQTLPHSICSVSRELFPVYVASPKRSRWSKLPQSGRIPQVIVMNPWTLGELEKAAQLYPDRKLEDIRERYHKAGPSAQLCLAFDPVAIQDFYDSRALLIDNTTTAEALGKLVQESRALLMDQFSHQICVIRRSHHNIMHSYTVAPVTDTVRQQLVIQIWTFEQNDVLKMLQHLTRVPNNGALRGPFFEAYFQRQFAQGINIDAKPMFRGHSKNSTFGNSSTFQEARHNASLDTSSDFSLRVTPAGTIKYDYTEQLTIKEAWYYIPRSANEAAIDSLMLHDGYLYLFQFTTGKTHNIKSGLQNVLNGFTGLPHRKDWRFIFIVPDDLTSFSCPHSNKGFLLDHIPFTAQVAVRQNQF